MLFRTSVPGSDPHGGPLAAPGFGGQLQDKAIFGVAAEAGVQVMWEETPFVFADGDRTIAQTGLDTGIALYRLACRVHVIAKSRTSGPRLGTAGTNCR